MKGSFLRALREERGHTATWVAQRAGYKQQHYSKIEGKESVTVEELENIARAMDLRPGDLIENSCGEMRSILPLVETIRRFPAAVIPHVSGVLEEMAAMASAQGIVRDVHHSARVDANQYNPYPSGTKSSDKPPAEVAERLANGSSGDDAARRHGNATKEKEAHGLHEFELDTGVRRSDVPSLRQGARRPGPHQAPKRKAR